MIDNTLIAKLSSLLEEEDPQVHDLILETVRQVEKNQQLSVDAHAKKIERMLDRKLILMEGEAK